MTKEELAIATGEAQYKKPQLLKLKSLKLNGDSGKFMLTHLDEEKGDNGRYRKEEIDGPVEVVFLKVRRRLIEASRDGLIRSTSEHNTVNDICVLFNQKDNTTEKMPARDLREKYENLRTEQIIYCRYRGEVVRLSVKGASLGSTNKSKATTDFYAYLSGFQGDDHFYEVRTKLVPVQEGETRTYWCINFKRGDRLDTEQQATVYEDIARVHASCSNFDKYYDVSTVQQVRKDIDEEKQKPEGEYPDEELNPEDIPF